MSIEPALDWLETKTPEHPERLPFALPSKQSTTLRQAGRLEVQGSGHFVRRISVLDS